MQFYEYRCPNDACRRTTTTSRGPQDRLDDICLYCGDPGPLKRVFAVALHRPMQEHFNNTVGKPISDMRQFRNELSRMGDEYSERNGIETNYQPVDMSDRDALGVTDAGLDETRRRMHAEGKKV